MPLRIDVLTLFPAMFAGPFTESILARAQSAGHIAIHLHNIRDYAEDKHHITDEPPYGGGGGMVMKVEPLLRAISAVRAAAPTPAAPVILTSPQGRLFNHSMAVGWAAAERLIFVCGRYEGIDERVLQLAITDEVSIGDYVLTGGELPTMVMIDAVARHIPGVLGAAQAANQDSHAAGLLEHAQYTRPASYGGLDVPAVLQGGDHEAIAKYRRADALRRTWQKRPDLLLKAVLSEAEQQFLATLAEESASRQGAKLT
jgi:tRNA (guanine37-N1)-methyltransferase